MRTTTRRRARLRSSQYATERWRPSPSVVVVAVGLLLGLLVGFRGRLTDHSAQVQQNYMLLVSDLYFQGSPLAAVRDRLIKIGFADASLAVVQTADQLAASPDKVKQQEADQLHQFAEALASGVDRNAAPSLPVRSVPTAQPNPTEIVVPTAAPSTSDSAVTSPPAAATTAPTASANVAPAQVVVTATPAPPPAAPAPGAHTGVIRSTDQKPVFLRHDPSTKAKAIASMPYGATVEIKGTVQGTAVDPGETHWYRVTYSGIDGFVYSKFVQVGG